MFKLWYIIQELIRFSRAAKGFLGESDRLIGQEHPDDASALRRTSRSILTFAVLFPIVCVIVPITLPCVAFSLGEYKGPALGMALFVGVLFSLAAIFFYLFAGIAVGCMLAPDEFMDSPVGAQWLTFIGTKNRTAARVVCFVAAVAGLLIMVGICGAEFLMLQSPALNK